MDIVKAEKIERLQAGLRHILDLDYTDGGPDVDLARIFVEAKLIDVSGEGSRDRVVGHRLEDLTPVSLNGLLSLVYGCTDGGVRVGARFGVRKVTDEQGTRRIVMLNDDLETYIRCEAEAGSFSAERK